MRPFAGIPLAWCNLTHDKRRFVVCVLGITFAILLMFVQLGFWNALLDASVLLIDSFDAQVVIVSKARYALAVSERFSVHELEQAKAVPGVAAAFPVYLESQGALWRDTDGGAARYRVGEPAKRPIRVVAFNPDDPVFGTAEIRDEAPRLRRPDTVLMDRLSKPDFGRVETGLTRELAGRTVHVVGTFALGTDFTSDGTVITSDVTFSRLLGASLTQTDLGLVQIQRDYTPEQVRDKLCAHLPKDVKAMTIAEFAAQERTFWQLSTPVGPIFLFGLSMGFLVGSVICFQILSADIADHQKEYATLKAIGYHNGYLNRVVLGQALWLAALAYGPAVLFAWLLYRVLAGVTGLPLFLNANRCILVFALASAMCVASGLIAIRKIKSADPAEVF
jgi:putative ABC transport system permease protein